MNPAHLIITVDYELPAGGLGDPRRDMIRPADDLMEVCERHGARLTLMAEMSELWAMENPANAEYLKIIGYEAPAEIRTQLIEVVRRGHDVQLHLHPQWLNAAWQYGAWNLDYALYHLSDLTDQQMTEVLCLGRLDLERLLSTHAADYACVGFRAGNWNTSPSRRYLAALEAAGLRSDTSVFKWGFVNRNAVRFDYRSACSNVLPWRADPLDINRSDPKGDIVEVPIASIQTGLFGMLSLKRLRRAKDYVREDKLIEIEVNAAAKENVKRSSTRRFSQKFRRMLEPQAMKLDFAKLTPGQMLGIIEALLEQTRREAGELPVPLMMIGHSKQVGAAKDLDIFLGRARKKFGSIIQFSTYRHFLHAYEAAEACKIREREMMEVDLAPAHTR